MQSQDQTPLSVGFGSRSERLLRNGCFIWKSVVSSLQHNGRGPKSRARVALCLLTKPTTFQEARGALQLTPSTVQGVRVACAASEVPIGISTTHGDVLTIGIICAVQVLVFRDHAPM